MKPNAKTEKPKKERLTIHVSTDIIDRVKNAVFWTPGLTLSELTECALTEAVDSLEKKRRGKFQKRTGELKVGRPMK
ncbi:MAG: hypothetical protein A3G34_07990 [Candidatus Lindowbacteria bacterium RIFCSPLOWO2_12_FULL_62_27]|nr:MAG: hypothetical protein A3G34_07990 [Candidatus Lindowbacteria bacterium RIFCSPLOWO2_12_FULL_62_27]OGH63595.1 MAG: hypothetical protein A3I06_14015 [Candidatus Lindowbacteria bacterium RIFCSPLOWO2_02_FULL_62_12]